MSMTKGGRGKTVIDRYKKVTISIHPLVLQELDKYAGEKRISRSNVIELALKAFLPLEESNRSIFNMEKYSEEETSGLQKED